MAGALAARMGDQVGCHGAGWLGLLAGAAAGVALGALMVGAAIATGGTALIAAGVLAGAATATGGASLGARVGRMIGGSSGSPCSEIKSGSRDTHVEGQPVARANADKTRHDDAVIAQGSRTVYVNGRPLARIDDKVKCGGKVLKACQKTVVGGEPTDAGASEDLLSKTIEWLDIASLGFGAAAAVVVVGGAVVAGGAVAGAVAGSKMALGIAALGGAQVAVTATLGATAGLVLEGILTMTGANAAKGGRAIARLFGRRAAARPVARLDRPVLDAIRGADGVFHVPGTAGPVRPAPTASCPTCRLPATPAALPPPPVAVWHADAQEAQALAALRRQFGGKPRPPQRAILENEDLPLFARGSREHVRAALATRIAKANPSMSPAEVSDAAGRQLDEHMSQVFRPSKAVPVPDNVARSKVPEGPLTVTDPTKTTNEAVYLYTIDDHGLNIARERVAFPTPRNTVVHSNLSPPGAGAYTGGELRFIHPPGGKPEVILNGGSGRYGPRNDGDWARTIEVFEAAGITVRPVPFGAR